MKTETTTQFRRDTFDHLLSQYMDSLKAEIELGVSLVEDHSTGSVHGMHIARDAAIKLQAAERVRSFLLISVSEAKIK